MVRKILSVVIPRFPDGTPLGAVNAHGTIKGAGKYKAVGTIINTDTLKIGDYVKVIPTEKGQKWFIDSKYRKVKE